MLSTRLKANQASGRKSFIPYIVAGDPSPQVTVPLMRALAEAGADAIELGVPFSDPEAEGPVIQAAHERALAHRVSISDCLDMVAEFRKTDDSTPVVLMGYLNPVETFGYAAFCERAAAAGVSGTIIVNLPPEEAGELSEHLERCGIESVYLLAPTTTDARAKLICDASRGFVYYVSLKGTTGAGHLDVQDVGDKMERFRQISSLPVLVGFGIRDGASAAAIGALADGVVVGSAIVRLMEEHQGDDKRLIQAVSQFAAELRQSVD